MDVDEKLALPPGRDDLRSILFLLDITDPSDHTGAFM
jgi:hypothetical protein